ncbi:hypothetical protein Sjap_012138 [Stephania japonica]|uniref:L-2-hydroxyglutarate dehydrogenase, mitochondrial n=1 Tax=Stephania japonica TaxID=461633 RepID=A0AAP0IXU7_9MAGN
MLSLRFAIGRAIQKSCSNARIRSIINFTTAQSGWLDHEIPTKERADCVVIGAGVVGIAVARELALKGREVLVVESSPTFGTGTSSRNSEVVHAGIYYPPNSLKARFCVRGRKLMYDCCIEHGVPHKQIGKLIVATENADVQKLNTFLSRGIKNGVEGLRMIEVDSHSLMLSLVGEAETHRTTFSYNTTVIGGHVEGNRIHVHVSETKKLENCMEGCDQLQPELVLIPNLTINSTGLSANAIARRIDGLCSGTIPSSYYARGCYFTLSNTTVSPFNHLIYPVPEDGGIGVHVTLDLDGRVKFGPNVEWIGDIDDVSKFLNKFDYSVNVDLAQKFYSEIRRYYPNLKDGSLEPGYAGIRPKLCGPGQSPTDFVIQGEEVHGVQGLVNLFGIESPGLTSSLAIAEHVASRYA